MRKTEQSEKSAERGHKDIMKDLSVNTQIFQPPVTNTVKNPPFLLSGS